MAMAPLHLDFHPRARRRPRWVAWAALVIAALLAALVGDRIARARNAQDDLQARQELLDARLHPAAVRTSAPGPELVHRIAADNDIIAALAVPWSELFQAIESADARGLGITSLAPNAHDRSVRMTGEARSVPDLLAYVERLSALRALQHVRLQGYETVTRDGSEVVTFTLAATWQAR